MQVQLNTVERPYHAIAYATTMNPLLIPVMQFYAVLCFLVITFSYFISRLINLTQRQLIYSFGFCCPVGVWQTSDAITADDRIQTNTAANPIINDN